MYMKWYISLDKSRNVRYNVHTEVDTMLNINITHFRKNIFDLLEQTIRFNEPINVTTKNGNAVVLSEEDYNGLMETLHLSSIPGMKEKIMDGLKIPLSECVPESEVEW